MNGADTRGFSYVLEPVRCQRQWKFDAALARVGKLYQQFCDKDAARLAIHEECTAQAAQVSRAWAARARRSSGTWPATRTRSAPRSLTSH